ncbi:FAD-dependent oxidoreductase [Streptantibioticus ferralitis]|uniref:FAD-dependent monooxygenase n=1 Tax=Streptantibioticus ferralitis TaxID=236510 RepID=A0ABT5YUJ7_9ACTN|nr:FAD-dependent oxidoreductase [Streptantibioticus ferralitis]MDF2255138.1 FAD-dependent monooxygenase [Streptantibioticus ferralitis]
MDVLVVGAGPTGLLLAGDLARSGADVTVLERRDRESNLSRAFGIHARTLEQLDARGLADELIRTGTTVRGLRPFGPISVDFSRLRTRFPFMLITPQWQVERFLLRRAEEAGATILRGARAIGLRQDPDGVDVDVRHPDGATATLRASYAVGADGARSTVRQNLGMPFPGKSAISSVMLADVLLERTPDQPLNFASNEHGFTFFAPIGDGWYRVIAWDRQRQLPDDAPVTLEEVRDITRRTIGDDLGMHDPRWLSRFHSDERQVPRYRQGRVFLAGDAAHIHSPAGGMGMNTGIQDAANLGWKLGAVLQGWAGDALLDSYHTERHPVGRMVLRVSHALLTALITRSPLVRALRASVAAVAHQLGVVEACAARGISGIGIAYRAPRGSHPLTGRRVPDLRLAGDPARLYEALRQGKFVLVGHGFAAVAAPWAGRVVAASPAASLHPTLLVRPDGYAAWVAEDPTPDEARKALTRWLGEAGHHRA